MNAVLCAALVLSLAACKGLPVAPPPARALPADLDLIAGPSWHGTLTYLDYQSGKPVSIRSTLLLTRLPGDAPRWELRLGYDDEPHANRAEVLAIDAGGRTLDGEAVVERTSLADGAVQVVTEADGEDDHRPARFRHVYVLGATRSSLQKLVRFAGTDTFFERNIYRWQR